MTSTKGDGQDRALPLRDRAGRPTAQAPTGLGDTATIASAGMLPNITYLSCPLCYGARQTDLGPCQSCADPDRQRVRWMLARLSADQIDFLRAFEHTLAEQPVTDTEHDTHRCEFFVEGSDGVWDEQDEFWLIPNTRHWFASGMFHSGPCGNGSFIRYNPAGLLLRECLMAGAIAEVPHMYPPRHAQGIAAGTDETAAQARPEGQEPGSQSECAHTPSESPHHDK